MGVVMVELQCLGGYVTRDNNLIGSDHPRRCAFRETRRKGRRGRGVVASASFHVAAKQC